MALVGLHYASSQAKARYLQEKYRTRAMNFFFFCFSTSITFPAHMSAYINSSHHTNTPRQILRRCSVKASHRRQMNAGVLFFFFFEATETGVGALFWGSDGFLTPAPSNEHGPEESSLGCTHCAAWHWREAMSAQKRSGPDASASSMHCIPTLEITLQMRLLKNTCK